MLSPEPDDPGFGIAKDTGYPLLGGKRRKVICIGESPLFSHDRFISHLQTSLQTEHPLPERAQYASQLKFTHSKGTRPILKGGGKHPPEYVEYEDSEYIRSLVGDFGPFSHKGKVWYDPTKIPILEKAPLQLSGDIESIKMQASFDYRGKLNLFYYSFSFFPDKKIDRKKYIDIFNAILGKPIKISDQHAFVIEYEGYTVSILTFKNEIRLLPVLPNIPIEKPSK